MSGYFSKMRFSCSHMVVRTILYCTRKCGCKGGCISASCFLQPPCNGSTGHVPVLEHETFSRTVLGTPRACKRYMRRNSTKTSTKVVQRGGRGCGLGVNTERMVLANTYIYMHIYTFPEYACYFMTLRLFGTPSESLIPCIMCKFVCSVW